MNVLDLFSGIGGFSLGLSRAGMTTTAFCEIDPFCQKVLKKHWPGVPIFNDVRSLDYDGSVELICGGFPCQPFSVAGKQKGKDDDRHLWPAMFSLIKKHRPRWVIGENVTGIVDMALDEVLADLESEAYTTTSFIIPACAINASHRRDRVWLIAHSNSNGKSDSPINDYSRQGKLGNVTHSNSNGLEAHTDDRQICKQRDTIISNCDLSGLLLQDSATQNRTSFCGKPDGLPDRLDRIKGLGNAVVPQIPEIIGRVIMEIESND